MTSLPTVPERCVVTMATLNEEDAILAVLSELQEAVDRLAAMGWQTTVVLIDDGSTDDTLDRAKAFGEKFGIDIRCLTGPAEGLGRAVLTGLRAALDEDPTLIVTLDADGQHDAREIPTLVRVHQARRADLTIGSRWTRGGRSPGTSSFRMAGSRFGNATFRAVTGTRGISDATTAFRVVSPRLARFMLASDLHTFRGYLFFSASVGLAESAGFRISEVPITFRPRFGGSSKLSRQEVASFFRGLPRIRAERRRLVQGNDACDYLAGDELEMLGGARRWQRYLLDSTLRSLPTLPERVLEVGAGRGAVLRELAARFPDAHLCALEPDRVNYEQLEANTQELPSVEMLRLRSDQLLAQDHQRGSWDLVLYSNVLEHIAKDVEELRCARELLRPGGHLAICVPALQRLYGAVDARSGHQRRYTVSTLAAAVEAAGFTVRECAYIDTLGVLPYWASFRMLNRSTFSSGAVRVFDQLYVPLTVAIDRLMPEVAPGKTAVCLAQRIDDGHRKG